jgi:luciferase family oxidoreductase group 1
VAEHHGIPMLAGSSPEVLIAAIAGVTSTIRVGSGGVMLPHYSPYKVAETFSILSGLHPDRIDLGVGRAPGSDGQTMVALSRDRTRLLLDDFPDQLDELLGYLENDLPPGHPFARLARMLPGRPGAPEVWLLGSSPQSAIWAGQLGLPYCFADFINAEGVDSARLYRERFVPSVRCAEPLVAVTVSAICAETAEEAERLAASQRMVTALRHRGEGIEVPSVERALSFLRGDPAARHVSRPRRAVVGTPETVRGLLEQVAADYGADELGVVTIVHDHGARRRSYELITAAFAERAEARVA